jgi:hypothetical protein
MVLCPKTRESRSPPGLPTLPQHSRMPQSRNPIRQTNRISKSHKRQLQQYNRPNCNNTTVNETYRSPTTGAGWSSPVARQAHNLKAAGSNPAPATKFSRVSIPYSLGPPLRRRLPRVRLISPHVATNTGAGRAGDPDAGFRHRSERRHAAPTDMQIRLPNHLPPTLGPCRDRAR